MLLQRVFWWGCCDAASHFAVRVINVWNTLPVHRVDFPSFAAFKRTLQQIDFCRCFYYVTRLMFFWVIISVTRDLIIQFTCILNCVCTCMFSLCENKWWWWWWLTASQVQRQWLVLCKATAAQHGSVQHLSFVSCRQKTWPSHHQLSHVSCSTRCIRP